MKDHLSTTFSALADPTRRAMLARLTRGEAHVSDLAKPFLSTMSLPAVTKHLKVLERAGLVKKTRAAQWRSCALRAAPLQEAADWMEPYRQFWEERLDRLGDYLKELQAHAAQPAATPNAKATPKQPRITQVNRKGSHRHARKRQ